jgi:ubiquinone biosynthesis protein UbiJ
MLIASFLNRLLTLDPKAPLTLQKLQGKKLVISITFSETTTVYSVLFKPEGIELYPHAIDDPDATIAGSFHAFLSLANPKNIRKTAKTLALSGDIETLERVQQLIASLDIDWEEWLSIWIGDIAAHETGNAWRYTRQSFSTFWQQLSGMIAEYLSEESSLIPTRLKVNDYLEGVDILRSDFARLELRLNTLLSLRTPVTL